MREPTTNPRQATTLRRVFYNFTRRYGSEAKLYKHESASVDRDTGEKTVTTDRIIIRNVVKTPGRISREVLYTPAMMQAIRSSAWQGSGSDRLEIGFLIYFADIRSWGEIGPDQWIVHNGRSYQVVEAWEVEGGWIVNGTLTEGSGPDETP